MLNPIIATLFFYSSIFDNFCKVRLITKSVELFVHIYILKVIRLSFSRKIKKQPSTNHHNNIINRN